MDTVLRFQKNTVQLVEQRNLQGAELKQGKISFLKYSYLGTTENTHTSSVASLVVVPVVPRNHLIFQIVQRNHSIFL